MKWIPENVEIKINAEELPTATVVALDLEYSENEKGRQIFLVGVYDGGSYFAYTDIIPEVVSWLRRISWIAHDSIHAELPVLNKLYGGFSTKNIYADTKIMAYVQDSTRKDYSLKKLVNVYLESTYPTYSELKKQYKFKNIDELPQDVLIQYNAADCYYTWKLWEKLRKQQTVTQKWFYENIEWPTSRLIFEMEQKGIKVDTRTVRRIHNENSKKRRQARKLLFSLAGRRFNPNSPKQVLPILQEAGARVSKTDEDTIKRYTSIPFVQALLDYRGLNKLCSTYTIPLYTEAIKTLDQRIHTRFGQNTITGRLSSSDPVNLQNQPKDIRQCFVPKEGHTFIEADWSNLEWRIPGHFSGDSAIISELSKRDGDIHLQTARLMFKSNITDQQRKIAKTCNFLLTNSGRAKRLSQELGCSYREAEDIYNKFWSGYDVLRKWTEETKKKAKKEGGVSTMYGRWVALPGLQSWCGRANCPVVAKDYFCKECFRREETEREAVSIRVQGSGSDLIKLAMLRLWYEYKYVPVVTVHDQVLLEVPDNQVLEVAANVKKVMEGIVSLKVPLFVMVKAGKSWGDLGAI